MALGDHLVVLRQNHKFTFYHHTIDCDDDFVIHYHKGKVCFSLKEDILKDQVTFNLAYFKINIKSNEVNRKTVDYNGIKTYSPDIVLARAYKRLGESKYCLFTNNCEHFAYWCKTGDHKSDQINNLLNTIIEGIKGLGKNLSNDFNPFYIGGLGISLRIIQGSGNEILNLKPLPLLKGSDTAL